MSSETEYVTVTKQKQIPYLTLFIILVNVIVFTYVNTLVDSDSFAHKYSSIPQLTMTGDYWRLLSNIFIHSTIWHLAANMLVLLWAGFECERTFGRGRMFVLYFLSGIGATLISSIYHIDSLTPPVEAAIFWRPSILMSMGASGAIMGVLAANLVMLIGFDDHPYRGEKSISSTFGVIVVTFLYGLKSGVDNVSHFGGLLSGIILAIAYLFLDAKLTKKNRMVTLLTTLVITGLIVVYYHTQVSSFSEKYKNQRDDIIEYFNAQDLKKRKEGEKEKKDVDAKIAEEKRLSDARVLHGSFPPAVDSETAMGTMLDIPGTTSVVFNPDNNVFYVGSGGTNSIVMLDANNYNKIGEVTPPECRVDGCEHDPVSTLALSPDRRTLYATSLVKDSFSIIDLASNVIAGNIPVGKMPKHMVLSPDGSLAWVLNELDNSISVIELKSRKVIREVKLPGKYDAYSSNFNFRPIAISHGGKLFAAYDTLESKLLIIDAKTFQIRGAGFNLDMDNATSLVFSMDDDSLWLSGREGVEQVDARSGNVLHSYSWCGDKFRKSDILFTLLDPEQSQLLLTANGDGGVYLVLYDLKTRSNIGQYPTSDDYGFPMLNLKDGTVMQGNHAHLQIANKNKSLATDPAATWLCERGGVGHESGYFN